MPFDGTGTSPILAVLIEGRRRIEDGWFQCPAGTPMPTHGHCAVFAISRQHAGELTCPTVDALALAVFGSDMDRADDASVQLAKWNDASERTKEDVIAAYDRAIAKELTNASL